MLVLISLFFVCYDHHCVNRLALIIVALVADRAWTRTVTQEEDWSKPSKSASSGAHRAAAQVAAEEEFELPMDDGSSVTELIEEIEEEEVVVTTTTTQKSTSSRKPKVKTTTTTAKAVVVMAQAEPEEPKTTVKPKSSSRRPSVNRSRPSSSTRGQPATKIEDLPVEEDMSTTKTTSPASLDTSSGAAKAPKNFRPTTKPAEDDQPKDLVDFLRRRNLFLNEIYLGPK